MQHSSEKNERPPMIWDLPLRIFHWLLAILVTLSVISAEIGGLDAMEIHFYSGYTILTLLLFRLLWGLFGTTYARFGNFLRSPPITLTYLRHWFVRPKLSNTTYAGHNPAGGYMVVLLLALLLIQATSGLFADDDIFTSGPLAHLVSDELGNRLTSIHHIVSKMILVGVALHILAIAFYELYKKQRLIAAMWHGRKALNAPGISTHRLVLATVILFISGISVAVFITQL